MLMMTFRVLAMGAMVLGTVGWLQADTLPADPLIKFTTGPGHSTDITCITNGCETDLSPVIGADGFATLDVLNGTGKNIAAMTFVIPTSNFDQDFFASTNAFENAAIFADEVGQSLTVQFSGLGSTGTGTGFLPADPTAPSGPAGFIPGGTVQAFVFFGNAPEGATFAGLANGQHGSLELSADAPEPSTFLLSLSGVIGLLVVRRKLRKA
jgi:hypothetical protein